jgi:hypothetical protein
MDARIWVRIIDSLRAIAQQEPGARINPFTIANRNGISISAFGDYWTDLISAKIVAQEAMTFSRTDGIIAVYKLTSEGIAFLTQLA